MWTDLDEAVGEIESSATVAIGGIGGSRKPMALLRGLLQRGVSDLRVVSFLGGVDVELLLASGAVTEIHTAGVSLDSAGLAPLYRKARQEGTPTVVEWSEGSLHTALEAASRGLDSQTAPTSPASDVVRVNPHLRVVRDPFTDAEVVAARALVPDIALLHAVAADAAGNVLIAGDPGIDGLLARCARRVVVSVSRRVERLEHPATLSRVWIDALVEAPGGAWPTACHPTEAADDAVIQAWAREPGDPARLAPEGGNRV